MEKEKHVNNSYGGDGDRDGSNYKVKMMCSYAGKIRPRAADHQLTYVGGDTKILTVDRNIRFSNLISKIHSLCNSNFPFRLKYQLPGYDLYSLVSVIDETDLENMMYEYDCVHRNSTEPARFRIFVFFSDVKPPTTPDFLFGFDKEYTVATASAPTAATSSTPKPEDTKKQEMQSTENVDSDSRDGAEIRNRKQIQRNEAQKMGVMPDAYSRDINVTPGEYAYGAPVFYQVPAPAATGYYQVGPYAEMHRVVGSSGEQPVYTFVPVFPSGKEQVSLTNGHVTSSNQNEGFVTVAGGGGGGVSMQPTVTSVAATATSSHETKVSPQA